MVEPDVTVINLLGIPKTCLRGQTVDVTHFLASIRKVVGFSCFTALAMCFSVFSDALWT